MKYLKLFFLLLFANITCSAQLFDADFEFQTQSGQPGNVISFDGELFNDGNDWIFVEIQMLSPNLDPSWQVSMCNQNGCLSPAIVVDTVQVAPFSSEQLLIDMMSPVAGAAEVTIRLEALGNPNALEFDLHAYALSTSVVEIHSKPIFSINPNQVQEQASFISTYENNTELSIFNLEGKLVFFQVITQEKTLLDLHALPQGHYFYRISSDEKTLEGGQFVKLP